MARLVSHPADKLAMSFQQLGNEPDYHSAGAGKPITG
jgi:hypothetical protein